MVASSANNRSSLAREQSLRRCFVAIHNDSMAHLTPSSINDSANNGQLKRVRDCRASRRNRRASLDKPIPPSPRQTITPTVSSEAMPSLPFCKSKDEHRQDEQRETSPVRKFQRKSSAPIAADVTQDMFTKIAGEKRRERRTFTNNAMSNVKKPVRRASEEHHRGFRNDYILGDFVRSPSHMIADPTSQDISSLQKHDFAFIKRSNGSYSYAILAFRSFMPIKDGTRTEECMTFVMKENGSTKIIRERSWSEFVRPASVKIPRNQAAPATSPEEQPKQIPLYSQEVSNESSDVIPNLIAFDSTKTLDDECSLISSVSDRARAMMRRNYAYQKQR